jgi:hypothetical protein
MDFFRGEQRKTAAQIKPHLVTESADCPGAGAVLFALSVIENVLEEV